MFKIILFALSHNARHLAYNILFVYYNNNSSQCSILLLLKKLLASYISQRMEYRLKIPPPQVLKSSDWSFLLAASVVSLPSISSLLFIFPMLDHQKKNFNKIKIKIERTFDEVMVYFP